MIYSLDEKVVGTWLDGKPIYQKTLFLDNLVASDNAIDVSDLNIDVLVYAEALRRFENDSLNEYTPFTTDGGYSSQSKQSITYSDDELAIAIGTGVDFDDYYVTIRYTKTTD